MDRGIEAIDYVGDEQCTRLELKLNQTHSLTMDMQIRELSVSYLFDDNAGISPVEKVVLAQEFRVRSWFLSGVRELLSSGNATPMATLLDRLGASVACKIIDLKPLCGISGLSFCRSSLNIALELLCCDDCASPLLKEDVMYCRDARRVTSQP